MFHNKRFCNLLQSHNQLFYKVLNTGSSSIYMQAWHQQIPLHSRKCAGRRSLRRKQPHGPLLRPRRSDRRRKRPRPPAGMVRRTPGLRRKKRIPATRWSISMDIKANEKESFDLLCSLQKRTRQFPRRLAIVLQRLLGFRYPIKFGVFSVSY